jgi:hypothetical protein
MKEVLLAVIALILWYGLVEVITNLQTINSTLQEIRVEQPIRWDV